MMLRTLLQLAAASLWHRRGQLSLVLLTLTLGLTLLLGVQYLRSEVRQSFMSTISGTDLIVGARSGPVNLLLYSVFHLGDATANMDWDSYQAIAQHPQVAWTLPISLGDSYRGHRVIGTSTDFLQHFAYGDAQSVQVADGVWFADVFDAVLGAEVARALQHRVGDRIVLAHGTGSTSFMKHGDKPFRVAGVLAPTGTPLDRAVLIGLDGLEAIHLGWQAGVPLPGLKVDAAHARQMDLTPRSVTAVLVGVKRKLAIFQLQRQWNTDTGTPLTAILPGVALSDLWRLLGHFEQVLMGITALVVITSLTGLAAVLLALQQQRQRETAVLRALGATPWLIAALYSIECLLLALVSAVLALALWYLGLHGISSLLAEYFGMPLRVRLPSQDEWLLLAMAQLAALLVSLWPAIRAYRQTLAGGLIPDQ